MAPLKILSEMKDFFLSWYGYHGYLPCNPSTGARADRTEGIASLSPVGWVLTDRWAATMAALIPTVSSGKDMGKDEPPGRGLG